MKHILITGGNKGIGLAATKLFLDHTYKVTIIARDFSTFTLKNPGLSTVSFDLTHLDKIPALITKMGAVDVLVNNAGMVNSLPYDSYPEDKKQYLIKLNLEAPVALIRECAKGMLQKKSGRIVNIASIAGQTGHPDVWYGISKAGLINATKSFAKILGPYGVSINAIAPATVEDTHLFSSLSDTRRVQLKGATVSNRHGNVHEIAQVIYWLATDAPDYINGSCIDVNSGAYLR